MTAETPATPPETERHESHEERNEWKQTAEKALEVSKETLQQTNQALALQARRMDDLAKLHESQSSQLQEVTREAETMLKAVREVMAAADQARSELVSVTAATVKIAQVMQQALQALQEESQN